MTKINGIEIRTIDQVRSEKMDGKNRTNIIFDDKTTENLKELVHIYYTSAGEVIRGLINDFSDKVKERRENMKTIDGCTTQIINSLRHMEFYLQLAEEDLDSKIDGIIEAATDENNEYDSFVKERKFIVDLRNLSKEVISLLNIHPDGFDDSVGAALYDFIDCDANNEEEKIYWQENGESFHKEAMKCFDEAIEYYKALSNLIHGK